MLLVINAYWPLLTFGHIQNAAIDVILWLREGSRLECPSLFSLLVWCTLWLRVGLSVPHLFSLLVWCT